MNPERLFETYLREYFAAHRENIARRGGLEEVLPELYARWSNRALPELGGKTPREYIDGMTDPADLLAVIEDSVSRGGEPSPMALDRLAALPSAERALLDLLENGENENMRITAAELLSRTDKLPAQTGAELVFDPSTPERLRETLVDLLKGTDGVTEILLDRIDSVEGENRKILAEMSVASGRTDFGSSRSCSNCSANGKTCRLPRNCLPHTAIRAPSSRCPLWRKRATMPTISNCETPSRNWAGN